MWFKLAGADFSKNNLGTMSSISSSYLIDYTGLTGMSGSPSSVSYAGSDAGTSKSVTVTVTITSGYTFKNGSTISASGGKTGTVFTADKDYTGGQTFTFSMAITANTKLIGVAEATGGSSSGGDTTKYTITYKYMSGSTEVKTQTTEQVTAGTTKTFSTSNAPSVSGYTCSSVSPSGQQTINSDITVTYNYTANAVNPPVSGEVTEVIYENSGFYNNATQNGSITAPNTSWMYSDLIPLNSIANGPDGYCTSMLQGHSKVAVVYYASSNSTSADAFLGHYGTTTQGEQAQYTAEEVKANAPEGTNYVGFSTHISLTPLKVYMIQ